jgi:hypothetical protein
MLKVAHSRLQDAKRADNSMETRFGCAYTAIRAVADAALLKQIKRLVKLGSCRKLSHICEA